MKQNVILIEDSSKSKLGGGQIVSLQVAEVLKNNGYSLVFIDSSKPSLFKEKMTQFAWRTASIFTYGKINRNQIFSNSSVGMLESFLFWPLLLINTIKILAIFRRFGLNAENSILYVTTKKTLLLAFVLNKILGMKYVFHAHSVQQRSFFSSLLLRRPQKNAAAIICVSKIVLDSILLSNTCLLYNAHIPTLDPSLKVFRAKHSDKYIIASFSNLIRIKGIMYFMQSYSLLQQSCPGKTEYYIYGEGEEYESLRKLEKPGVTLRGFCTEVDKQLMTDVDVLVFPSIISEACPTIIIQALTYGIPVVSTNIGGQAELIIDGVNGLLVDPENASEIAAKLDLLMNSATLYKDLSAGARESAEKYSYHNFHTTLIGIFESVFKN